MTTKTLTEFDMHLWAEGSHFRAYDKLGAHPAERNGVAGTQFAVWAPNASQVAVVGDFNDWRSGEDQLYPVGSTGIWAGFVPGVGPG
ncbi:MAG TPA: 1,4-alpha-glucan branching enzyme, partial [Gemmataceae bacterium]|nr:1,4-alpha-glucan branching enzyme [Gemmataceae bacterium]